MRIAILIASAQNHSMTAQIAVICDVTIHVDAKKCCYVHFSVQNSLTE
jgi:hypothetical protein